ncbi:MAG TPA: PilZ domain-containing protein [Candidatus Acidoferrales bacterium]|nr:PilZ domain-containing protein [Candidatus Acidoferrales bacterium]
MNDNKSVERKYPRKQLEKGIVVAWQGVGGRHVGRAKTLGMGGLYIETAEPPAPGSYMQVLLDTPEGEVRARAVVRKADIGQGMGIEFVGMDQAARAHLHSLLKRLLA